MPFEQMIVMDGEIAVLLNDYRQELKQIGSDIVGQCLRTSIALAPKIEKLIARHPNLRHLEVEIEIGNWGRAGRWAWTESAMKSLTPTKALLTRADYHSWISIGDTIVDLTTLYSLAKTQDETEIARTVYFDTSSRAVYPGSLDFNYDARLTLPWYSLVAALSKS